MGSKVLSGHKQLTIIHSCQPPPAQVVSRDLPAGTTTRPSYASPSSYLIAKLAHVSMVDLLFRFEATRQSFAKMAAEIKFRLIVEIQGFFFLLREEKIK